MAYTRESKDMDPEEIIESKEKYATITACLRKIQFMRKNPIKALLMKNSPKRFLSK